MTTLVVGASGATGRWLVRRQVPGLASRIWNSGKSGTVYPFLRSNYSAPDLRCHQNQAKHMVRARPNVSHQGLASLYYYAKATFRNRTSN